MTFRQVVFGLRDVPERDACRIDQPVDPAVGAADVGDDAEPVALLVTSRRGGALAARQIAVMARAPSALAASATALPMAPAASGDQKRSWSLSRFHPSVVLYVCLW